MVYNILDYGAVPDGITKATKAIQAAIDDCTKTGGQVLVPSGRFLSGSLHLKSDVDLLLEQGAVLISSLEQEDMIDFAREYEDDNADVGWDLSLIHICLPVYKSALYYCKGCSRCLNTDWRRHWLFQ